MPKAHKKDSRKLSANEVRVALAGFLVWVAVSLVALYSEPLASLLARVVGFACIAWAFVAFRRPAQLPPMSSLIKTPFWLVIGTVTLVLVIVATVFCSWLLWYHRSQIAFMLLWIFLALIEVALFPVTLQALVDNGMRLNTPWPLRLLHLTPIALFVPIFAVPEGAATWAAFFLVPAAMGFATLALAMWSLAWRVIDNSPEGAVAKSDAFLVVLGILCAVSLAMACVLLANLYDYPYTSLGGWLVCMLCSSLVFAVVLVSMRLVCRKDAIFKKPLAVPTPDTSYIEAQYKINKENSLRDGCRALSEHFGLTGREEEIVEMIAYGDTRTRIAEKLTVSRNTVNTHAKHGYAKLGISSRAELLESIEKAAKGVFADEDAATGGASPGNSGTKGGRA
ncbi:MAG: response regulator transcription factor [Coriobacteriales bacterium]